MNPRFVWILVSIFAVTIIALSVLLPLYFLKWKASTSKGLAAGSGPLIVSEIQVPWFYPYFFTNSTDTNDTTMIQFATDANGQVGIIDANGYMTSINGAISRTNIKQITTPSNMLTFFSKNSPGVALATVSELQARIRALKSIDLLLPVTNTSSNGSFCLSDDRTRLFLIKIDETGAQVPVANVVPTYDTTKIPNTCFVTGYSNYNITDYIDTQAYNTVFGPVVNGIGNTIGTRYAGPNPNSLLSNVYFIYRVPFLFMASLFVGRTTNLTNGALTFNKMIPMEIITNSGVFLPNWSLATLTEANTVLETNSYYCYDVNPTTFYITVQAQRNQLEATSNSSMVATSFQKQSTRVGTDSIIKLSTFTGYHENCSIGVYWMVKYTGTTALTDIPKITDVMNLSVSLGLMGSLSPATEQQIASQPEINPPTTSTDQQTNMTATTNASGEMEFSKPKSKTFIDQYGLYLYIATGVVGSILVIALIWYWKLRKPQAGAPVETPVATPVQAPVA
uniref:Uncharacterized protein n=1 Tax=viral metagenome TaxID=1070528 RepID=A0A6C0CLZ0_9ZZZZ